MHVTRGAGGVRGLRGEEQRCLDVAGLLKTGVGGGLGVG